MSLKVDAQNGQVTITRASREVVRFTIRDETGAIKDVSGWSWKFTVKADIDDAIGDAAFQLVSPLTGGQGIDTQFASAGVIDVYIPKAATAGLAGDYVYDLQGTAPGILVDPQIVAGASIFRVLKHVTTDGTVPPAPGAVPEFPDGIAVGDGVYIQDPVSMKWHKLSIDGGFPLWSGPNDGPPPF